MKAAKLDRTYRPPGDYCDVYLTHDSMSVRKAHNSGRNHLRNVVDYYQRASPVHPPLESIILTQSPEIGHEKAQSVIDSITSSYAAEGQSSSNPMLGQNPGVHPPPPFAFPGGMHILHPSFKETAQ
jgi:U1 small nuclear ribonucleoprotein C